MTRYCTCRKPLYGERPGVGPRCRLCNLPIEVPPAAPTPQHAKALQRMRFQCLEGAGMDSELAENIAALDWALATLRQPSQE